MTNLEGKTAIVTGSSRGIGRAIAQRLAKDGVRVVVCARTSSALDEVVREIAAASGTAAAIPLDLRDADSASRLVDFTLRTYGGIDILVNNAGATRRGAFIKLTDEDW